MRAYLGDGVYLSYDGHAISLTTENGFRTTNRVVLEPEVYGALLRFGSELWPPAPCAKCAPLAEALRWVTQTVHQAHHDGAAEECPKTTCSHAWSVLGERT